MAVTIDEAAPPPTPFEVDPRVVGVAIEYKLREWSIPYDYVEEFTLADVRYVDWTQARDSEHVNDKEATAEFRVQMAGGAVFPPIVLMHPNVLVDGNTRSAAAKGLHRKTFPAFVAQFPRADLAKAFAAAINQLGGRRLTSDEAHTAALTMMAMGMADEAVAREIGRSVEMVRRMRRSKEYDERAQTLNLAALPVTESDKVKLARIAHNPVFAEAVQLVAETRPSAKDVSEIVATAEAARDDTEGIAAIRQLRADLKPAGPPPVKITLPQERRTARMGLGQLLSITANPTLLLETDPEARQHSVDQWTRLRDLADRVLKLYSGQ